MTTPNHQPTPPPGMPMHLRLATEEDRKGIVPVGTMFAFRNRHYGNASDWMESGNVGFEFASNDHERDYFYAIPITPTVPATEDTTNEKGGEPCASTTRNAPATQPNPEELIQGAQPTDASNAPAPVQSQSQGQEKCPECGAYRGHSIDCERKTPEEWRTAALQYHKAWLEIQSRDTKWLNKAHERANKMRDLSWSRRR